MLTLKPSTRFELKVGDQVVRMRIRRPKWEDVLSLGEAAMRAFGDVARLGLDGTKDPTEDQVFALVRSQRNLLEAVPPEDVRRLFTKLVYDVEDLAIEDDEGNPKPITTGEGLIDVADSDMVMATLMHIYGLSKVSLSEGKGSSSPSTSLPVGSDGSVSPAQSIESASGTTPSTATVEPEIASSGVPAT